MIGVFIGIQVANWNDTRIANVAEVRLMARLAEEMQVLEAELADDAENYKSSVEATGTLLTVLRAGVLPADEKAFRWVLWRANHYSEIPALSASYSELVSSGGLSRISNHDLRATLVRYGDSYERYSRLYSVAIGTVLDPNSHYLKSVEWATKPELWDEPETAIVSFDWAALQSSRAEL